MRQREETDNSEKKRDRRLIALAGGIFVLALCVFGGLHRQQQAAQSQPAKSHSWMIADISPEVKTQFVEHAKMLREKWEPWAKNHQVQLKKMLSASSKDEAAMLTVWDAIPPNPRTAKISPQELMPSGDPTTGVGFGWAGAGKGFSDPKFAPPRAEAAAVLQRISKMVMPKRRREFKAQRDIVIAVGGTRTQTSLWASGRITQRSLLPPEEYRKMSLKASAEGRQQTGEDSWAPAQEMVPPYDFLTQ